MKDSTLQDLQEIHRKAKGVRQRFESDWYLNLAFYSGDQWVYWSQGRIDRPKLDRWRVTLVDNRIIGIVRTEVAKLTKQSPVFVVTPNTGEDADVNAAHLGEQIAEYTWTHLRLHDQLAGVLSWARIASAGFWKVYWDDKAGESTEVLVGPDGAPIGRAAEMPDVAQLDGIDSKIIYQGEVGVDVRSPFQIYPDPVAEELEDCEFLVEETVQSQEYVLKHYGVELEPDTDVAPGVAESRSIGEASTGDSYKGIKVMEYWAGKSSTHTAGKRVVWVKDQILKEDENPVDVLPYVMFKGIDVPGRFWPTSVVSQLRGPQTELNKVKSQIAENRNRLGNPALMTSRQANVEYTGIPGERINYDDTVQNATPSYLMAPEIPGYVREEIDRAEQAMREISGQHEVTNGQVPTGITAASAINLLMEQDDTRLGPAVSDMEMAIATAGEKILKLVAQFYSDARTVRISGENGALEVFDFKGEFLKGNTSVEVQTGSSTPRSKAGRVAHMQEMLNLFIQNGIPMGNRELARYLKDMDVGGVEKLIEQYTADENQVNRENRQMTQGVPLQINSYDNDEFHIAGHEEDMKQLAFQNLPPQFQAIKDAHLMQHRERLAMQMQPPGGPGQPPAQPPQPPQQ